MFLISNFFCRFFIYSN